MRFTSKLIAFILIALLVGNLLAAPKQHQPVLKPDQKERFTSKLYLDLFFTHKLYTTKIANLNSDKVITGPVSSWQLLAEFTSFTFEGDARVSCLFYKIPMNGGKRGGILRMVGADKRGRCHGRYLEPARAELPEIKELKLSMIFPKERRGARRDDQFHLVLEVRRVYDIASSKGVDKIMVPMINLDTNNVQYQDGSRRKRQMPALLGLRRYRTLETVRVVPGVMILPGDNTKMVKSTNMGNLAPGDLCLQINDQCEIVGDVVCDRCPAPSYPVVSSKCQKRYGRVCGPDRCGTRGAPACIRGFNYQLEPIKMGCSKDSPAGLCRDGLHTFCDERNVLVCL